MRLIVNQSFSRRTGYNVRIRRVARLAISGGLSILRPVWNLAFPIPPFTDPDSPAPVAKAAALREGARLAEEVEAKSERRIA
jgi:hypothetical protein